jgi:hypothetical protein
MRMSFSWSTLLSITSAVQAYTAAVEQGWAAIIAYTTIQPGLVGKTGRWWETGALGPLGWGVSKRNMHEDKKAGKAPCNNGHRALTSMPILQNPLINGIYAIPVSMFRIRNGSPAGPHSRVEYSCLNALQCSRTSVSRVQGLSLRSKLQTSGSRGELRMSRVWGTWALKIRFPRMRVMGRRRPHDEDVFNDKT